MPDPRNSHAPINALDGTDQFLNLSTEVMQNARGGCDWRDCDKPQIGRPETYATFGCFLGVTCG